MVDVSIQGAVAHVELARPEVGNAFNPAVIDALIESLRALEKNPKVRLAVLSGRGKHFCSGADLTWMRASANQKKSQNHKDAMALHELMVTVHRFTKPMVAKVHGSVYGGGIGLTACADIVVADANAQFCLSEVRLGIVPAVIAPFVLRKIGPSWMRALGLSAKKFSALEAKAWGLVHEVTENTDASVNEWITLLLEASPEAQQNFKSLLWGIDAKNISMSKAKTTRSILRAKSSKEGREGLASFLEKKAPSWRTSR